MFGTSLSRHAAENLRCHLRSCDIGIPVWDSGTVAGSAQGHASVECWHDGPACRVSDEKEVS